MGDHCRLKVATEKFALKKKEFLTELTDVTSALSQVQENKDRKHDSALIDECMKIKTMADQIIDKLKDAKIQAQDVIIDEQNLRSTPGRGQRASFDSGVYSADIETLDPAILARENRAPRVASESSTTAIDDSGVGTDTSINGGFIALCSDDSEA